MSKSRRKQLLPAPKATAPPLDSTLQIGAVGIRKMNIARARAHLLSTLAYGRSQCRQIMHKPDLVNNELIVFID
jgi:hypothetical protein